MIKETPRWLRRAITAAEIGFGIGVAVAVIVWIFVLPVLGIRCWMCHGP